MCNSEIYTYMNKENPNYCKTHPTHGFGANWCQNALLVLGEVCEYTRTPSWGLAIFTQSNLQNHRQM